MTAQLPTPTAMVNPEAEPFWRATAEGRLVLQRCSRCSTVIWYPRGFCPTCASSGLEWFDASGNGVVYSFTVNHKGIGAYAGVDPYVLAYVELAEGPRVLTNIVDCVPTDVRVGDEVVVVFHDTGAGHALVRFRPREKPSG